MTVQLAFNRIPGPIQLQDVSSSVHTHINHLQKSLLTSFDRLLCEHVYFQGLALFVHTGEVGQAPPKKSTMTSGFGRTKHERLEVNPEQNGPKNTVDMDTEQYPCWQLQLCPVAISGMRRLRHPTATALDRPHPHPAHPGKMGDKYDSSPGWLSSCSNPIRSEEFPEIFRLEIKGGDKFIAQPTIVEHLAQLVPETTRTIATTRLQQHQQRHRQKHHNHNHNHNHNHMQRICFFGGSSW